jgi:hypothetical protein
MKLETRPEHSLKVENGFWSTWFSQIYLGIGPALVSMLYVFAKGITFQKSEPFNTAVDTFWFHLAWIGFVMLAFMSSMRSFTRTFSKARLFGDVRVSPTSKGLVAAGWMLSTIGAVWSLYVLIQIELNKDSKDMTDGIGCSFESGSRCTAWATAVAPLTVFLAVFFNALAGWMQPGNALDQHYGMRERKKHKIDF